MYVGWYFSLSRDGKQDIVPSFRTKEFIFTHFYKTGGMWFHHLWNSLNLSPILEEPPREEGHQPISFFKDWELLPSIVCYRNPFDWYESLYLYHIKTEWMWVPRLKGILFNDFVELSLSENPMSKLWSELVLEPQKKVTEYCNKTLSEHPKIYMVQHERMCEELGAILNDLGFNITKEKLFTFPKINSRTKSNRIPLEMSSGIKEKILNVDRLIFDYYINYNYTKGQKMKAERPWLECQPCDCKSAGFCQRHKTDKSVGQWMECIKNSYHRHGLDINRLYDGAICYLSTEDLVKDTYSIIPKIKNCKYVLGVARSGLIPASIIATAIHRPIYSIDQYSLEISNLGGGSRLRDNGEVDDFVYLVDDSSWTGRSTLRLAEKLAGVIDCKIKTVSIYTSHITHDHIDVSAKMVHPWHIFEWNLYNSIYKNAYDIDGVLCRDFTTEEDDDGDVYIKTIESMETTQIQPRRNEVVFITSRLEKYRDVTEKWLVANGFRVKDLLMGPWSTKTERNAANICLWKAKQINKSDVDIYIESDDNLAREISKHTNKIIICPTSGRAYRT